MHSLSNSKTECLINNKVIVYDACSSNDSLDKAKKFYKNKFEYIGSSNTYYINGRKNISEKLHHFFKRK